MARALLRPFKAAAPLQPVIAVALAAALTGCLFQDKVESFDGPTMGSTFSIKYVRSDGVAEKQQLVRETEAILADLDRQLSTYRSDSDIERFNAQPAGRCEVMPEAVRLLVDAGKQLSEESDGAFDLTLEPLLNLWGFGPNGRVEQVPAPEKIAEVRHYVGYQHLRVDGQKLCKDAAVELDFNSIAAGYAVDRVAARLQELGVRSYLVEITGELKAQGRKPDGASWRIAIEAPRDDQRVAQQIIELDGLAVSTSGDYRNYFERDGRRYSHTLDPQTGSPIEHKLAAVTVLDGSALRADGLSTTLMVMGPERGFDFASQRNIAAFFVIREGQNFVTKSTPAFQQVVGAGVAQ